MTNLVYNNIEKGKQFEAGRNGYRQPEKVGHGVPEVGYYL